MSNEKLEAFIQLFLLDHGHAVEDEVIRELVKRLTGRRKHWQSSGPTGKSLPPRVAALTKVINALDDLAPIAYHLDAVADREKYLRHLQMEQT